MKLIKLKTRGPGQIIETGWLDIGAGITSFAFQSKEKCGAYGQAVESLNPVFAITERAPFQQVPRIINIGGYQKKIHPSKRTMGFGIFTSEPALVRALSELSPFLFETDRIEIGRRLDYSRWFNFVELASSTRWSEIASSFRALSHTHCPPDEQSLLENLQGTDRIKGSMIDLLAACLTRNESLFSQSGADPSELAIKINRAADFQQAFTMVSERMPLTIRISDAEPAEDSYQLGQQKKSSGGTPLDDLFDFFLRTCASQGYRDPDERHDRLAQLAADTKKRCLIETDFIITGGPDGSPGITINHSARYRSQGSSSIWYLQLQCALAQTISSALNRYPPILIHHQPATMTDQRRCQEAWQLLNHYAKVSQLLYLHDGRTEPPEQGGRVYHESEIALGASSKENTPKTDSTSNNHESVA